MCLLIAVNERFKFFKKPERLEIALHTLNDAIYLFYDLFVLLLCIYMHIRFMRCK
jgi:hypothetical protein